MSTKLLEGHIQCAACGLLTGIDPCSHCGHVESDKSADPEVEPEATVPFRKGDDMEPLHVILDALGYWQTRYRAMNWKPWADYEAAFDRSGRLAEPSQAEYEAALEVAKAGVRRMIEMGVELPSIPPRD